MLSPLLSTVTNDRFKMINLFDILLLMFRPILKLLKINIAFDKCETLFYDNNILFVHFINTYLISQCLIVCVCLLCSSFFCLFISHIFQLWLLCLFVCSLLFICFNSVALKIAIPNVISLNYNAFKDFFFVTSIFIQ